MNSDGLRTPSKPSQQTLMSECKTPDWMAPISSVYREPLSLDLESENDFRCKAISELVESEKSYLKHLEILETFFSVPLRSKFPRHADFKSVFGDIPTIRKVNAELLEALESSKDRIGLVFLELAPYLKFYSTYANDFASNVKLVERLTEENKEFRRVLHSRESRPEALGLKLNSLLITPIQRIPRYKLLLEDLLKNTSPNHPDRTDLTKALLEIEGVARYIDNQIGEHENARKTLDIQKSLLRGLPKILKPGRTLLKTGLLMKVPRSGGGNGIQRFFVLFNDTLLYCKVKGSHTHLHLPKPNSLECCCLLPLKHAKVETIVGNGVFKVTCKREELILYSAEGPAEAEAWVEALKKTIGQLSKDASTLRKESSKREPMRRPEILKLRRESLSLILLMRKNKEKEDHQVEENKSPSKKRPATSTPTSGTPSKRRKKKKGDFLSPPTPPSAYEVRRSKRSAVIRKSLKSLSFNRKETPKRGEEPLSPMFQSPSIYGGDVMKSYLSEKLCPLTPSQKPTSVEHLAQTEDIKKENDETLRNLEVEKEKEEEEEVIINYTCQEEEEATVNKKEISFSSKLVSGCFIM
eukprot:TRINITY_DN2857_c0_g1_i2.p2 TRINITY_DN2857_c0_g1~~TRINITY_DN2857_c0_g1_i2.p2  ORF type:complete len:582 (-),score=238.73 TRINITY_DN2857_c0_g1_i2:2130-3875(-)